MNEAVHSRVAIPILLKVVDGGGGAYSYWLFDFPSKTLIPPSTASTSPSTPSKIYFVLTCLLPPVSDPFHSWPSCRQ